MSSYFKDSEFECGCGCGLGKKDINETSLLRLEMARGISNTPYKINSAVRCKKHNKNVGGKINSSHIQRGNKKPCAFDIEAKSSRKRWKILRGLIEAGFNRIGIGNTFIHADDDLTKPPAVMWLY